MRSPDEIAAEIEGLCAERIAAEGLPSTVPDAIAAEITFADAAQKLMLEAVSALRARPAARPLDEWHEDFGPALWWKFPVEEAPWCGGPLYSGWPGYHTHWTPLPPVPADPGLGYNPEGEG